MAVLSNVTGELPVRPFMFADQPVILITDPYLSTCGFKNCGFTTISVQYRVVVVIVLDMIVIGNPVYWFIVAYREASSWQCTVYRT